jgi:hypothetical protein
MSRTLNGTRRVAPFSPHEASGTNVAAATNGLNWSVRGMKSLIPLLAALSGIALSGCVVGVDDRGAPGDGIFTVEWRIDGAASRADCAYFGADVAYLTVESRFGREDEATVPCEDFGYDFFLLPGDYWVTVQLLDRRDRPISSIIETDEYPLYAGDGQYVVADFPPDSFF